MTRIILISIFGTAGVLSRYFLGSWVNQLPFPIFPIGTFAINSLGGFLIGMTYALSVEQQRIPEDLKLALMVGFLGGFTTFSTYCLELFKLFEAKEWATGIFYLILSPGVGLGATFLGVSFIRFLSSFI